MIYVGILIAVGVTNFSTMSNKGLTQFPLLIYIVEMVFLFLSSFYVLSYYWKYRMGGGIKGRRHGANKMLSQGGSCLSNLCGAVTKKADSLTKGDSEQPLLMQQMNQVEQMQPNYSINNNNNGPQGPYINQV